MSQRLLLTSAGMRVKTEILKILPGPPSEIKLAHIITATTIFAKAPWRDRDKKSMLDTGFQVEDIDIVGKNEEELYRILKNKDIIYVQGGDPYYLLKCVKESGFDHAVKELIAQGKLYVGVSAGTYIACPTIEQALWKNPKRKKHGLRANETAMGLVPFLITVHYEESMKEKIKKGMKNTSYQARILTDDQAILVKNGKEMFVGRGIEVIF